jgi:hypothetical protein
VQQRKVSNCKIQLNNSTYSATLDDAEGQGNMYLANEMTIAVHCDPDDISQAFAYEDAPNGRLLARLVSDELAATGPVTQDHLQAATRLRAKMLKSSKEAMAAYTFGVPSELELLSQRATGTDGAPSTAAPRFAAPRRLPSSSAFVSDDVARDGDAFKNLLED